MEAALSNGWYAYVTQSKHTLDAPEYAEQAPGARCMVKFLRTYNTGLPAISVRFLKVDVPLDPPGEANIAMTHEYTRIYSPRRYLWFFADLEDEALTRLHYEGKSLGGKPIKRKMVAY